MHTFSAYTFSALCFALTLLHTALYFTVLKQGNFLILLFHFEHVNSTQYDLVICIVNECDCLHFVFVLIHFLKCFMMLK